MSTVNDYNAAFDKFVRDLWDNTPGEIHVDSALAIKRTLALLRMVRDWSEAGVRPHPEWMALIAKKAIGHLEPFEVPTFAREGEADARYKVDGCMAVVLGRMFAVQGTEGAK